MAVKRAHEPRRGVIASALAIVAALVAGASVGACGETTQGGGAPVVVPSGQVALATPAVSAYVGPPRGFGAMGGVRATRMGPALAAAGLDPARLPPLESLAPGPRQRVMRTFTEALGVPCVDCHAQDDFVADTRRKRVAKRMWNELVRVVAMSDGAPIYCDSCHDGALFHLDRRDPKALALYMCESMVGNLKRIDGRAHDCTSCHGDPPDFRFLATWKASRAPDITSDARAPGIIVPQWPTSGPREPEDCGPNGERCPLAAWMRLVVAPAMTGDDRQELARALDHVAAYAPDNGDFVAMARSAAEAARRGGAGAVRGACARCHEAQKAGWRAAHRTQAPP